MDSEQIAHIMDAVKILAIVSCFALILIVIAVVGRTHEHQRFAAYGHRRVLQILSECGMTCREIHTKDQKIASIGTLPAHLQHMEDRGFIRAYPGSRGPRSIEDARHQKYEITERGRMELIRLNQEDTGLNATKKQSNII